MANRSWTLLEGGFSWFEDVLYVGRKRTRANFIPRATTSLLYARSAKSVRKRHRRNTMPEIARRSLRPLRNVIPDHTRGGYHSKRKTRQYILTCPWPYRFLLLSERTEGDVLDTSVHFHWDRRFICREAVVIRLSVVNISVEIRVLWRNCRIQLPMQGTHVNMNT